MEEKMSIKFGGTKKGLRNFITIYSIIAIVLGLVVGVMMYSTVANEYIEIEDCENCSVYHWSFGGETWSKCWMHEHYESKEEYISGNSWFIGPPVLIIFSIIPASLIAWLITTLVSNSKMMATKWVLEEDNILVGKRIIPLAAVTKVEHGTPKSKMGDGTILLHMHDGKFQGLVYPHKRSADGARVAAYIEKRVADNLELEKKEYRMRCNVCGKVFCYKLADLRRNLEYSKRAKSSANMAMLNAIGGTQLGMYAEFNEADRYIDKIVDYSKCPECHSTDLTQLTDEEWGQQTANQPAATASAADELKKYKELLDGGIISQGEFDAKKKQLLGL